MKNGAVSHRIPFQALREEVSCHALASSLQAYSKELESVGFKILKAEDVTVDWRECTTQRALQFEANNDLQEVIGESTHHNLLSFYKTIAELFSHGNLGGLRIVAQKPFGW